MHLTPPRLEGSTDHDVVRQTFNEKQRSMSGLLLYRSYIKLLRQPTLTFSNFGVDLSDLFTDIGAAGAAR